MKTYLGFFGCTGLFTAVLYVLMGQYRHAVAATCIGLALLCFWAALLISDGRKTVDNLLKEECRRTCLGGCIHGTCIREDKK